MFNGSEQEKFNKAIQAMYQGKPLVGETGISQEHIALLDYRRRANLEVERRLGRSFWISPDITTAQDILIPARKSVFVRSVIPDTFEPFYGLHPYVFSSIFLTTRSRFAQLGVEVDPLSGFYIVEGLSRDIYQAGQGNQEVSVLVHNFANRPIYLEKGTPFFCLYQWDRQFITGPELRAKLGTSILIEGKEGADWRWWYGQQPSGNPDDVQGIEFFINKDSAAWVPPSNSNLPMTLYPGSAPNHNRDQVDTYLHKPVPETSETILWIAELRAHLEIKTGIHGLLDSAATINQASILEDNTTINYHRQTNSLLFRGGNANYPRTEVYSPFTKTDVPDTELMRFVRA